MKRYVFSSALWLMAAVLFAQTPFTAASKNYSIQSHVSQENADLVLTQMEALLAKYNSFFLFDLTSLPAPFNITVFADKMEFDTYLSDKIKGERSDFVYLHYKDPAKRVLAAYSGPADTFQAMAFQGFIQYLWNFVPTAPAWVRNGFAYYFWDFGWDDEGKTLTNPQNYSFLESLKAEVAKGPVDLQPLLTLDETTTSMTASQDYLAWGMIHFLLNTDNQGYSRLMGNVLANIRASDSQEANSRAILTRVQNTRSLTEFAADFGVFVNAQEGYPSLMEAGVTLFKNQDWENAKAAFTKAMNMRPQEFFPYYYLGLVAYETKDYEAADVEYAKAEGKNGAPVGLLAFARGLNSFYLKDTEGTKTYLTMALEQNSADYGLQAQQVLDLIK